MWLPPARLRAHLGVVIRNKAQQGHQTDGLADTLDALPDSADALITFAERLAELPLRPDWPYHEPDDLPGILAECDPQRSLGPLAQLSDEDARARARAAFLGSVCGCMLGKPIESATPDLNLAQIRTALSPLGEWPIRDYLSERAAFSFPGGTPHPDWVETVRERLTAVAPDDDLNYTLLGLLLLEQHGPNFTQLDLLRLWMTSLPPGFTWGPERATLAKAALHSLPFGQTEPDEADLHRWVTVLNPYDEYCGALIRADAYGYACAGDPARAATLAWRDASLTHRRTGVYGTMFVAAAIATAFVAPEPLFIFETALRYLPQRSRLHAALSDALAQVAAADSWEDGYARIHARYGEHVHCQVYQEAGTLINTVRFARDVGDGLCVQVMQGNDTDSFGATAGSILGAYFGPGHLEARWSAPFHDTIYTRLAGFREQNLTRLADRVARLTDLRRAVPA